ncbi:hypothetical protein V2W30_14055 [Streptomyces sp. Q6]|uniref:Uncharacterized protein n=1 Tax=Streptomyces citrinus TaxID=3118173 RepID=A0ACD5AAV3_9ACTN
MATARKRTPRKPVEPAKCETCKGSGEISVAVRVGGRKQRTTGHQQTGMCLACFGSGEATD